MSSLPWIAQEAEATRKLMGDNFYSYGIGGNRRTLERVALTNAHPPTCFHARNDENAATVNPNAV